jgi:cytochrome bd ubiquinol oxidase subunit I
MNTDLARWQFATTSIYHFLFVPVTIGLAFLIALLQTAWHRSGEPEQRRLARFFGILLLINVAVGVVTGLVQEFEFGMNWSAYSRFVGDVFGAPLAMEGLAAFFLESTFLGLWIFGWDRLPKRVHLACIWLVAGGSMLSAAFILAANSWMQHPVGYSINHSTNQPQLNNVLALFTNPTFLWGYVHVILASVVTGCLVMLAVSAWYLRRGIEVNAFKRSAHLALIVVIPALGLALFVGSELGVVEAKYQPVKIAAAEAEWSTCQPCSFSAFQIGGGNQDMTPTKVIAIPYLLSFLATNSFKGQVVGLSELQQQYSKQYGPGNYISNVFIQYWSMRVMAYLARGVVRVHPVRRLAAAPPEARALAALPEPGDMGRGASVPDEHRGMDADRERPATLDSPGADEDHGGRLTIGERDRDLDQPDRVRAALRDPGGGRPGSDAAIC